MSMIQLQITLDILLRSIGKVKQPSLYIQKASELCSERISPDGGDQRVSNQPKPEPTGWRRGAAV